MEEALQEILGEIRGMKSDIGDLKAGQARLETRLGAVGEVQANVLVRLDGVEAAFDEVKRGQLRLETRIESEVIDKVRVLFDAFQSHEERLACHEKKLAPGRKQS